MCEMATVGAGGGGGGATTTAVWSSRWNVQCQSQCSENCSVSIPWKRYRSWLNSGMCDTGCNTTACGYDGGDCTKESRREFRWSPKESRH
jgi:hypothetical protein